MIFKFEAAIVFTIIIVAITVVETSNIRIKHKCKITGFSKTIR